MSCIRWLDDRRRGRKRLDFLLLMKRAICLDAMQRKAKHTTRRTRCRSFCLLTVCQALRDNNHRSTNYRVEGAEASKRCSLV